VVGGVAAPSEIAVGVPNDLDLICRMTLGNSHRGPVSPGDLALQIAPWASGPLASHGGTGLGYAPRRDDLDPTLGMPASSGASASGRYGAAASGVAAGAAGLGAGLAGAGAAGATASAGASEAAGSESSTLFFDSLSNTRTDRPGAQGVESDTSRAGGIAAAGAAAAGVASTIGDRVGSFAKAAADKATARAAERRSAHHAFDGEDIGLADALDEAPTGRLEPPLPGLGRGAADPSGSQSKMALAIVGVLVVVALIIGINNVAKIGQHDGPSNAGPTVTVTKTRPGGSSSAPGTSSEAPPTSSEAPPAGGPTIVRGKGYDEQDGNEADQNADLAFDGNPSTGWRSRWYASAGYNGGKDGLGLILGLSGPTSIKEVVLDLPAKQNVTVYATNGDSREGAHKVGSVSNAEGQVTITAPDGLEPASNLIVFVTKAAPAEAPNHYRAQINEVTVR
jgi:hypothetical protein